MTTLRDWREWVADRSSSLKALPVKEAGGLAPVLLDTVRYGEVADLIASLPTSAVSVDAGLAYARATTLVREAPDEAIEWFVRAHALVGADDPLLLARISRDLGAIYVRRGETAAAEAVLTWSRGILGNDADRSADLLQLAGLLADHRGDGAGARSLNARSIETSARALSPMTHVVGLSNLAAAVTHQSPKDSIALCRRALNIVTAEHLHPGIEGVVRNVLGYALIPIGDLTGARHELEAAATSARAHQRRQVELFARFNQAILQELDGDLFGALRLLTTVASDATEFAYQDIARWAQIRSLWISHLLGQIVANRFPKIDGLSAPQLRALEIVKALSGDSDLEIGWKDLARYATEAVDAEDRVEGLALSLQVVAREHGASRWRSSRRWVRTATRLALEAGLRCGTNWWGPELVDAVEEMGEHEFARSLIRPSSSARLPQVQITVDGEIEVDGHMLAEVWREGRTGSRVLKRLFGVLLTAYPGAIARDTLCDLLWPESEGDRAVRNLYGATDDLRKALRAAPGIRLIVDSGSYRLDLDSQVRTLRGTQTPDGRAVKRSA